MNVSFRRAQSKPSSARTKTNKPKEHEGKQKESTSALLSSTTTTSADISSVENTAARRAARSKADNEQGCSRHRAKGSLKRKREMTEAESQLHEEEEEDRDEIHPEVEIDQELDRELENKSKQHNLTSANVRSIIHEVITNEHVVAMMKAAINETEPVPLFEPKMTRSKLKEVVEKGVVIPAWNISPIKKPSKVQGPQFVDIPLEEEDSSDEEYCPDEEEEDETAEETHLESDLESTASSPRGARLILNRSFREHDGENSCSPRQSMRRLRHVRVGVMPMGPPPPPQGLEPQRALSECSFMEKLHAVDEELAIGTDRMNSYQSLTSHGEERLVAFRTRSKRPLRDVPLGRLEAELRAPDITPDMYEFGSAPEDREWTQWLQGLMNSDVENEEEGDDDDDPEYNFLADIDEPDVEDYRNDKAVRITKKEVNDLMEELFDAFQDELGGPDEDGHEEEEEKEEDDPLQPEPPNILETIPYQNPLADILNQSYRTVKEQLAAIRKRKAILESKGVSVPSSRPNPPSSPASLFLSPAHKLCLQQHIQQHVQLLTQMNMLSRSVDSLQTEACTSRQFLSELQFFAQRGEQAHPGFITIFKACNLQGALSLLKELDNSPVPDTLGHCPVFRGSDIPAHLAWLMATRPVFLYPQLLPRVKLRHFNYKSIFTPAENCLVVLGYQHFKGTLNPLELMCQYLLVARNYKSLRHHVHTACHKQTPNIIKKYFLEQKRPSMSLACGKVNPNDQRPPVERERHLMPHWLSGNLKLFHEEVKKYNLSHINSQPVSPEESIASLQGALSDTRISSYAFPLGTLYPPILSDALARALKPSPPPCRKKPLSQSTDPSKPPPSTKDLEEALSRLPPILPKIADQTVEPSQVKTVSKRQRPHLFKTVLKKTQISPSSGVSGSNVTNSRKDVNQGKLILTLPTALLNPSSLGTKAVNNNGGERQVSGSSAAVVAPASQENIVMALSPAFICPAPIAKVVQTHSAVTPLFKEHMSQQCSTFLKLSLEQGLNSMPSHNSHFIILPTSCVITNSASYQTATLNTTGNCEAQKGLVNVSQAVQDYIPQSGNLISYTDSKDKENHCFQKNNSKAEEEVRVDPTIINEEAEECQGDIIRKPFLTLSESSGSPTSCLAGEDDNMEAMMNSRVEQEQEMNQRASLTSSVFLNENELPGWTEGQKEHDSRGSETERLKDIANVSAAVSELSKLSVSMFQSTETERQNWNSSTRLKETTEEQLKVSSGPDSEEKELSDIVKSRDNGLEKISELEHHNDNLYDDDPRRDMKDVALAQAYLEKVCEALQVVPGKVEEFLSVLYEFERKSENRTEVDLFMNLKPVLNEWPELLRDFAAFLDPKQAQECGLITEQQAFERSRRFLRQLELSFGEHSVHYKKAVRTLQQGLPKTLSGVEEIKAQISMLFCDHTHLLEEYWGFFEHLYPGLRHVSKDYENDIDRVSAVQMEHVEGSPQLTSVRASTSKEGIEAHVNQSSILSTDAISLNAEVKTAGSPDCKGQSYLKASQSPVCAKNTSRMPSGEKIVLWTREADRVILTTCQQRGACQSTFTSIAADLGNKTADQVGARYLDLMKLFYKFTKIHHTSCLDP